MADNWVSPTGHDDPDGAWTNEANAYDGNTGTDASCAGLGKYLELTIAAIRCDKVRFFNSNAGAPEHILVDVYYDSDWHNVYDAAAEQGEWTEASIGTIESVTAARIKYDSLSAWSLGEFEFNNTTIANLRRRVKLAPQDPYAVSLAPTTPYEVTVAPSAPYVVTIL